MAVFKTVNFDQENPKITKVESAILTATRQQFADLHCDVMKRIAMSQLRFSKLIGSAFSTSCRNLVIVTPQFSKLECTAAGICHFTRVNLATFDRGQHWRSVRRFVLAYSLGATLIYRAGYTHF